ncbi:MAG: bifunctional riboflavin kinase/FAD synthetase [Prevotella sp.]|nr:bifunctional riboflavin kinase/FAD synthetase [Prevotella sp.]
MRTVMLTSEGMDMQPCVATIGFFDGVHKGHQYLVSAVIEEAHQRDLQSMVITFDRHPREVLGSDFVPRMLSTYDEKLIMLSKTGVDTAVVLPFDREMASLTAYDFMRDVLRDRLNVKVLVIGYDNRFGSRGSDVFDDYVRYGRELGIDVISSQSLELSGVKVSSSVVRSLIQEGEIEMAHRCLGYPYTIVGTVVKGYHIGTGIGFPTANITVDDPRKLIPSPGVYAVWVRLSGSMERKQAMMNIGMRPTFDGRETTLEVHILHYCGNLYGEHLSVSFIKRLRQEHKFRSVAELTNQLHADAQQAEEVLGNQE